MTDPCPPSDGVNPFNTLAPLAWCVERVRQLRRDRSKRIAAVLAVLTACAVTAVFLSLDRYAQSMLDDTMRSMNDLNIPTKGVRQEVQSYRSHWNPLAHTRRRNEQLDAAYAGYQGKKESADFDAMVEPMGGDTKAQREQNLAAYRAFLEDWPASEHRVEVEGYRNRARTIYAEEDARVAFVAKVETLFRQVEAEPNFGKRLKLLDDFLAENTRSEVPANAHDQLDRVSSRRVETLAGLENARWQSVITYCEQNADQHANCIERIDGYLAENPESSHMEAAKVKKREVETLWDRKTYEELRSEWTQATVSSSTNVPAMMSLKTKMMEYRDRVYPPAAMSDFVGTWVRWFEALEKGREISVYVEHVDIVRSGPLDDDYGSSEIQVTIRSFKTYLEQRIPKGAASGVFVFKQSLGPFSYRLGERLCMEVREIDGWWDDDVVEMAITPLSIEVVLMKGKKRAGKVRLRVAGQTDLPPHGDGK